MPSFLAHGTASRGMRTRARFRYQSISAALTWLARCRSARPAGMWIWSQTPFTAAASVPHRGCAESVVAAKLREAFGAQDVGGFPQVPLQELPGQLFAGRELACRRRSDPRRSGGRQGGAAPATSRAAPLPFTRRSTMTPSARPSHCRESDGSGSEYRVHLDPRAECGLSIAGRAPRPARGSPFTPQRPRHRSPIWPARASPWRPATTSGRSRRRVRRALSMLSSLELRCSTSVVASSALCPPTVISLRGLRSHRALCRYGVR
jgi:hypothetical protein